MSWPWRLGFRHPDVYGAILCASPGGGYKPPEVMPSPLPRAYLVAGTEEPFFRYNAVRWAKALRNAGADVVMHEPIGDAQRRLLVRGISIDGGVGVWGWLVNQFIGRKGRVHLGIMGETKSCDSHVPGFGCRFRYRFSQLAQQI